MKCRLVRGIRITSLVGKDLAGAGAWGSAIKLHVVGLTFTLQALVLGPKWCFFFSIDKKGRGGVPVAWISYCSAFQGAWKEARTVCQTLDSGGIMWIPSWSWNSGTVIYAIRCVGGRPSSLHVLWGFGKDLWPCLLRSPVENTRSKGYHIHN